MPKFQFTEMEKKRYCIIQFLKYNFDLQILKPGWFKESLTKFNDVYSLIKDDVRAPLCVKNLKITLEQLKEGGVHKKEYF